MCMDRSTKREIKMAQWTLYDGPSPFSLDLGQDGVEVQKHSKRTERGQYSAILTKQTWSIKSFMEWENQHYISNCGTPWPRASRQDSSNTYNSVFEFWLGAKRTISHHLPSSGSPSQPRIWFILSSREVSHTLRFIFCAFSGLDLTKLQPGLGGRGVLNKVLYREAPPRGPTPYPFIYHFGRKGTLFIYLLLKKVFLSHTYFR